MECLDRAMDAAGRVVLRPSLYTGFTGVGWAVEHLAGRVFETEGEDPNEEIDEALSALLTASSQKRDFELIHGLAGFGIYAVERFPGSRVRGELHRIVDHLRESAERKPEGMTWLSPPEGLGGFRQEAHPQWVLRPGHRSRRRGCGGFLGPSPSCR